MVMAVIISFFLIFATAKTAVLSNLAVANKNIIKYPSA